MGHFATKLKHTMYLSPLDGFISSFGFFFGVSFWIEDDLWLQGRSKKRVRFGPKTKCSVCYLTELKEGGGVTSASTVPALVQDSSSHSACHRQVNYELAGFGFPLLITI